VGGCSEFLGSTRWKKLTTDIRPPTGIVLRKVRTDGDWADDRPCATSKRTSDTKYPEGDPMFVADPDGCESRTVMDDELTYSPSSKGMPRDLVSLMTVPSDRIDGACH
jgi:hypothetical protein